MVEPASKRKLSPAEYLAFDRASEVRHEYADGEAFAMAGGTLEHSAISANVLLELGVALRGTPCRPLTSDMRIKVAAKGRYVYPDGAVVCGQPELEDETRDTLMNPTVVIEVLSDSSEAYDRGDKFEQYQTVASLQEYVLASQKAPRLEVFTRQKDGSWLLRSYTSGQRATLVSLACEIAVDGVYARVFAPAGAR